MQANPTAYTKQLTHDLLRRILEQYNEHYNGFSAVSTDDAEADADELHDNVEGHGTSTAHDLKPAEAAKFLSETETYRTRDADRAGTQRAARVPLARMLLAARFAACFDTPAQLLNLAGPQSLTCLELPHRAERQRAWDDLPNVLVHLGHLASPHRKSLSSVQAIVLGYRGKTQSDQERALKDFEDGLETAIECGRSIVALVPGRSYLSEHMQPLVTRSITLPPLCRTMVIEILRHTHALGDDITGAALRDLMPSDTALAKMPLPLLHTAFHGETAQKVLSRLSKLSDASVAAPPSNRMTLQQIHLPLTAATFCDGVLTDLQDWQIGKVSWSEVPCSALFYGPPGNGKTSLAAALAGSAGIPLVSTSYADCQRAGHQGDFLRVLSDKVTEAISSAPCVFFLDELDSFGLRNKPTRNSDYIVGVVNGLLEHLSRLNDTPGVIVIGATNHPHLVDPAILRPGRFDAKIHLGNPDCAGILRIMEIELGANAKELSAADIASRLLGVSGAQVSAVIRDAREKARRSGNPMRPEHLSSAVDHIAPQRPPELLRRIAIHEAGHAVVGHRLGLPPPRHLQLTAFGGEYGYAIPDTLTERTAQDHLATLLGGRTAEIVLLGNCSSGADSDLAEATQLAFSMRYRWGMRHNTMISISQDAGLLPNLPSTAVQKLNADLRRAGTVSKKIIKDNRALVHRVADGLLQETELNGKDLLRILHSGPRSVDSGA